MLTEYYTKKIIKIKTLCKKIFLYTVCFVLAVFLLKKINLTYSKNAACKIINQKIKTVCSSDEIQLLLNDLKITIKKPEFQISIKNISISSSGDFIVEKDGKIYEIQQSKKTYFYIQKNNLNIYTKDNNFKIKSNNSSAELENISFKINETCAINFKASQLQSLVNIFLPNENLTVVDAGDVLFDLKFKKNNDTFEINHLNIGTNQFNVKSSGSVSLADVNLDIEVKKYQTLIDYLFNFLLSNQKLSSDITTGHYVSISQKIFKYLKDQEPVKTDPSSIFIQIKKDKKNSTINAIDIKKLLYVFEN